MYHEGELAVQLRAGARDQAARVGRSIRSQIPPAAQTFLNHQPMVILATADTHGRLWASVVTGEPGFLRAESEQTLLIEALPPSGDPLMENLAKGAPVGVLIIDLATRRRLRLNGRVMPGGHGAIRVAAEQVYSNCPKYIQARSWQTRGGPGHGRGKTAATWGTSLTDEQQRWVARADTFFIASRAPEGGADASHRGGHPGFVRVADRNHLAWGDYAGNNMFQTLGNISVNPSTGLLFIDFESGSTLQLTGSSRIVWDPRRIAEFSGAQRVLEFELEEAVETTDATRLRWQLLDYSPFNRTSRLEA